MARQDSPTDFNSALDQTEPVHGEPVQGVDLENDSGAFLPQDDSLETPLLPVAVDGINRGHAASTKVAAKDKGWAIAFKMNVVVTVIAAVWFGKMAIDAVANDSLSGAGRRRLQLHGSSGKSFGFCVFGAFHTWAFFFHTYRYYLVPGIPQQAVRDVRHTHCCSTRVLHRSRHRSVRPKLEVH